MGKEATYLPLEALKQFEKGFPNVFQRYDEILRSNHPQMSEGLAAYMLGAQYGSISVLPKRNLSDVERLKENVHLIWVHCTWQRSKQVYRFSKELYQLISESEGLEIDKQLFVYLPFTSFYIETEWSSLVHGVFTKYVSEMNFTALLFVILFRDGTYCKVMLNLDVIETLDAFMQRVRYKGVNPIEVGKVLRFMVQACMYLCAKNCDVVENEEQKKIYNPHASFHNRYSEIRKWDVGYRVANPMHATVSEHSKKEQLQQTGRSSPRQHLRRAHWHTYWCGQGRTRKEVKFLAPMIINDIHDEMPVAVHH